MENKKLGTIEPRTNDYISGLEEWDTKDLLGFINGAVLKYNSPEYYAGIIEYIRKILKSDTTKVKESVKESWVNGD